MKITRLRRADGSFRPLTRSDVLASFSVRFVLRRSANHEGEFHGIHVRILGGAYLAKASRCGKGKPLLGRVSVVIQNDEVILRVGLYSEVEARRLKDNKLGVVPCKTDLHKGLLLYLREDMVETNEVLRGLKRKLEWGADGVRRSGLSYAGRVRYGKKPRGRIFAEIYLEGL